MIGGLTVIRDLWDFNYQRYGNTHDKRVLIDNLYGIMLEGRKSKQQIMDTSGTLGSQ